MFQLLCNAVAVDDGRVLRVGFVGCGNQGLPMAQRILAAGAGQRAKLLNNALCNAQIRLASDALALGEGIGLDGEALATVLRLVSAATRLCRDLDAVADRTALAEVAR